MDQICNLYPGIVKVEYFDSSLMTSARPDLDSLAGLKIEIPEDRLEIHLIEPGTCEVKSADGAESLTLKFSAQIKIYPPFRPAFVIHDANGRVFLIGSKSKPFPKISHVRTFGSVPDARPEVSYEITYTAIVSLIEIIL